MGGVGTDAPALHGLLVEAVAGAGAHIGALYLLDEDERVLLMDAAVGFPAAIARAWSRIRMSSTVPVVTALRERRLVWLAGQEDLARQFPGAALTLPYRFSLLAAPIRTGAVDWGALLLVWPAGQESRLTHGIRAVAERSCRRMGALLREAALRGTPVTSRPQPRLLPPARARQMDPDAGMAALECLNGLPEGYCVLDVDGRVTFLTTPAAELLGAPPSRLLGERPWEVLPWLNLPQYEDRYRASVISQVVTGFTARRPGGQWLAFQLYPTPSGVSVRITPSTMARDPGHLMPDPVLRTGSPPGATTVYDLLHLATTLSQAATVQQVIDLVADQIMPVFRAQALAVLTAESGRLMVSGSRGYSREQVERFNRRPAIMTGPGTRPLQGNEPLFFATWRELIARYPRSVRYDDMSAWAFLPLVASERYLGTFVLAYDRPHHFTSEERATLTALAGLVAQALERAYLYDAKHRLAQSLQASLLPRRLPYVPGLEVAAHYLPATRGMDIGGDFYDLILLDGAGAAAVIGDVQGHDSTAAALMGQVRTAIHAYAASGVNPGGVLAHANRLLIDLAPNRFTSCLYLGLDLRRRQVHAASAGHLPALLHRPGAPAETVEVQPGLLLGIDPHARYPGTRFPLPPGATLALYTDGLVEAPGLDIDDAVAGLAERFTRHAHLPLEELAATLTEPTDGIGQRADDIALLLLRTAGE